MSHSPERIAAFIAAGQDDEPDQWFPMWIMRSAALKAMSVDPDTQDEWTWDDNELNYQFHEWLEDQAGIGRGPGELPDELKDEMKRLEEKAGIGVPDKTGE
jgi:hypothetical protein